MVRTCLLIASFSGWLVVGYSSGSWAQTSDYLVRDLLAPCIEGDNDARDGSVLEMECEQFIAGVINLYVYMGIAKKDNVCLPEQNQEDEVRWAFMRWGHHHFDQRHILAVQGLLETFKAYFKCK